MNRLKMRPALPIRSLIVFLSTLLFQNLQAQLEANDNATPFQTYEAAVQLSEGTSDSEEDTSEEAPTEVDAITEEAQAFYTQWKKSPTDVGAQCSKDMNSCLNVILEMRLLLNMYEESPTEGVSENVAKARQIDRWSETKPFSWSTVPDEFFKNYLISAQSPDNESQSADMLYSVGLDKSRMIEFLCRWATPLHLKGLGDTTEELTDLQNIINDLTMEEDALDINSSCGSFKLRDMLVDAPEAETAKPKGLSELKEGEIRLDRNQVYKMQLISSEKCTPEITEELKFGILAKARTYSSKNTADIDTTVSKDECQVQVKLKYVRTDAAPIEAEETK